MDSHNNRQNSYIILLEILVIIIGAIFGVWRPLKVTRQLNQTLAEKSAQLRQVKNKEAKIAQLKTEFAKRQVSINRLNIAAPEKAEVAQALMILEAIAAKSGVELTSLNPQTGEGGEVIIVIKFNSDFNQLKEMFSLMRTDLRPIQIKSIKTLAALESNPENQKLEKRPLNTILEVEMPYAGQAVDSAKPGANAAPALKLKETQ